MKAVYKVIVARKKIFETHCIKHNSKAARVHQRRELKRREQSSAGIKDDGEVWPILYT